MLRYDSAPINKLTVDAQTGFLIAKDVPICRVGVFPYRSSDGQVHYEAKLPEEILSDSTIESANGKPITDDHPANGTLVDSHNVNKLGKGFTATNAHQDGDRIKVDMIVTEMGHITEQATADFYEDSNIEQYQYLATLEIETHTCEVCAHLDERIFYVKDRREGLNYPMIHPYCRCTTVPYMKDLPDIETRWSRDPETGKGKFVKVDNGPKRLTFREWKKLTVDSTEYHKIVDVLGGKAPVSLAEFLNLKYNDSERYRKLDIAYKDAIL